LRALPRLVHICIPHNRTPCGRGHGGASYRLSWVSPFLSGRTPLALCVFIISQDLRPVKTFFNFFSGVCWLYSLPAFNLSASWRTTADPWGRALRINPLEPPSQVGDLLTPLDCLYYSRCLLICQYLF
jgi:hypothetical protein